VEAIAYLCRAAEQATQYAAQTEAVELLQEALWHVERLPAAQQDTYRPALVLRQARALLALGHLEDAAALLLRYQLLFAEPARLHGQYALLRSQIAQHQEDWEHAAAYAQTAVRMAREEHDEGTLGQAYYVLAMERYWAGQPLEGLEYSQSATVHLDTTGECFRLGMAYFVLGLHAFMLGDFERALEAEAQASRIGDRLDEPQLQTFASWATGWFQAVCGAYDDAILACQRALKLTPDPLNAAFAMGWMGFAYLEKNEPEEAVPLLEQAITSMRQFHYQRLEGLYAILLGEAHLLQEEISKAAALLQFGNRMVVQTQYRFGLAWSCRALGKLACAMGELAQAEEHYRQALEAFTAIPTHFEVARTHLALAELAARQGFQAMTAEHLRAAYRLFTTLRVATYVARTEASASALGVAL
jgi:tetratricopeptide (TPR) repeat protein